MLQNIAMQAYVQTLKDTTLAQQDAGKKQDDVIAALEDCVEQLHEQLEASCDEKEELTKRLEAVNAINERLVSRVVSQGKRPQRRGFLKRFLAR